MGSHNNQGAGEAPSYGGQQRMSPAMTSRGGRGHQGSQPMQQARSPMRGFLIDGLTTDAGARGAA